MKLRIISGTLKGRIITIPEKDQDFRPTKDRVREAVASMVASDIPHANVADICAGSGAFGFEMISRGALCCHFVEQDRFRSRLIRQHAEQFGVARECSFFDAGIAKFTIDNRTLFDIIYYDPPYDDAALGSLSVALQKHLAPGGVLLYERRSLAKKKRHEIVLPDGWTEIRSYGETEICIFRNNQSQEG